MELRVRLAFTIGYIGRYFHGSQVQPDVETVQGELIRVFRKLKWLDPNETSHNLVLSSSCLLYTSPSPRDRQKSRMPSSA